MALSKTTLNRIVFIVLIVIVAGGGVYFFHLSDTIEHLQQILSNTEQERIRLQTTLDQSHSRIQTQYTTSITLVQDKEALQHELDDFKLRLLQLQELLTKEKQVNEVLQDDQDQLLQEVRTLREEIRLWEGNIATLDEADAVIAKRAKSNRELDKNIRALRARLRASKRRIQGELDRLKLGVGNRGYITENGVLTFNAESAVELDRIIIRGPTGR